MINKWKVFSLGLVFAIVVLIMYLFMLASINENQSKLITEQETRINEQSDLIRDMTVITTAYDNLVVEYEALTREYQDYRDNNEKRVALSPLEELLSENEISAMIKQIPKGTPHRGSFSVTSPFGESVGYHGSLRDDHQGTDTTPDDGDWMVTSVGDGVVEEYGENRIFGKYILIKHTEYIYSFYAHLEKIYYTGITGKIVTNDTVIGLMGSTGYSDSPHLHSELRLWTGERFISVDGLPFMNRGNNE